jgi:hypothetical protein
MRGKCTLTGKCWPTRQFLTPAFRTYRHKPLLLVWLTRNNAYNTELMMLIIKGLCAHVRLSSSFRGTKVVYLPIRRMALGPLGLVPWLPSLRQYFAYRHECRCSGRVGATICLYTQIRLIFA